MSSQPSETPQGNDDQEELLEGYVAQVLNERELVINIGYERGVREGMIFAVLSGTQLEILDPITKEPLDTLEREKVRVEAVQVQPKIAICRTYEYREVGGVLDPFGAITQAIGPRRRIYETLRAAKEEQPRALSQEESYVKIGDKVRQWINPDSFID